MVNWFQLIVTFIIGFFVGRFYPLVRKFGKFLDKEREQKKM
jgi:hypothetical protein